MSSSDKQPRAKTGQRTTQRHNNQCSAAQFFVTMYDMTLAATEENPAAITTDFEQDRLIGELIEQSLKKYAQLTDPSARQILLNLYSNIALTGPEIASERLAYLLNEKPVPVTKETFIAFIAIGQELSGEDNSDATRYHAKKFVDKIKGSAFFPSVPKP